MKKTYIQPQIIEVNFQTEGLIATSPGSLGVGGDGQISSEEDFLSNKKQPGIWDDGKEETKNGIW